MNSNGQFTAHDEAIFVLLFVVATAVAIAVRRWRIPYTVALVITGLVLGFAHAFQPPPLSKELLFSVFLPGLIFEAAFHIDFKEFWRNKLAIASLAVPGVVAATALTAFILTPVAGTLHFATNFDWRVALVFGALISATDPIAVVAIFRNLGAPKRLAVLLDGESLLNDGTAIVFFTLSLALTAGSHVSPGGLALDFVKIVGGGLLIGLAIGLAVSQIIRRVDDAMIEITLTTIAAYGSFVAAEQLDFSGVIATVAAGMFCGNYAARTGMSPSTRVAAETFWEYVAFALNSIVFLLIGFEVNLHSLLVSWKAILVAYAIVTIGRAVVTFVVSALLKTTRERIPFAWSVVLTWGGLRGGLPMVLVLSLPSDFPYRELLVSMTFGVVILSILGHGLTISPLLRWLGIVTRRGDRRDYELARGRMQAARAALAELDRMAHMHFADTGLPDALRQEYEQSIEQAAHRMRELPLERQDIRDEEMLWARRRLLLAEKDEVINAFQHGILNLETYNQLLADVDARLLRIESGEKPEPVKPQDSGRD
ncbi:MAG TPA: Na+/H+ antiporter [Verrucomicrobiae bacterium]|nr:Na+/H+ antiporter [Verrucomicrobiae bacterium]